MQTLKDFKFRQALVNLWCCKTSASLRQSSGCSGRSRERQEDSNSISDNANSMGSMGMVTTAVIPDILSTCEDEDGCTLEVTQDSTV